MKFNIPISQERRDMIDQMKPERMATDGQWNALKYIGVAVGASILAMVGSEVVEHLETSSDTACPAVVNINHVPECK